MKINTIPMIDVQDITVGMIDSGTTFTYFPTALFEVVQDYLLWFCAVDKEHHCIGSRMVNEDHSAKEICFTYDENRFNNGPKEFFLSFPVFSFTVNGHDLHWYPSEYFFRARKGDYCMAVEKYSRPNEVMMGGTFMR